MSIDITTATIADASALAICAAVTFPLACPPDSPPEEIQRHIATQLSEERFAEVLARPGHTVLCIREEQRIAGWSMVVLDQPADADVLAALSLAPTVELSKFYVHPDHHGLGSSAALMDATLQYASGTGLPGVWLGVNQENARAIRFYEKSGFRVVDFIMEQALAAVPPGA
jgi:ribosomal protein S18 acetylase RimI-like enzyme